MEILPGTTGILSKHKGWMKNFMIFFMNCLKWDAIGLFCLILKFCEAKMHFKVTCKNNVKKTQEVHHKFST